MFNEFSKITFICKFLCLLLFILSTILVNNIYVVILLVLIVSILSLSINKFFMSFLSIILIISYYLSFNFGILIYIFKGALCLVLVYLTICFLSNNERRYIYEMLFYSKNGNTKWLLKAIYYRELKQKNLEEAKNNNKLIKSEINKKTLYDLNDIYIFSKIRFYKYYKKKSLFLFKSWSNIDNFYALFSFAILMLSILVR